MRDRSASIPSSHTRLAEALRRWLADHPHGRLAVALSGGMDSMALLHALAQDPDAQERGLRAVHVDHGLHPDSRSWARHCRDFAHALGTPIRIMDVEVDTAAEGVEAGARRARYAAIARTMRRDEWLLTAQHAEDQAETVLLKLMRGADLEGLAGMHRQRPLGRGFLARPLLDLPRRDIHAHALAHGLKWIDDPSNSDPRYDRAFLRCEVLPVLVDRWPGAVAAIGRTAAHLDGERRRLRADVARMLDMCRTKAPEALCLQRLRALPAEMQPRILLNWLGELGWNAPSIGQLETLLGQLTDSASTRSPSLRWSGYSLRRHRERLHAVAGTFELADGWSQSWDLRHPLALPNGDHLRLVGGRIPRRRLQARARRGGERIQLPGRSHSTSVKHALQDLDLPPWRRAGLPFLWDGDELVAVGSVLVAAGFAAWLGARGLRLVLGPAT